MTDADILSELLLEKCKISSSSDEKKLTKFLENYSEPLSKNFRLYVTGWHKLFDNPIKESIWEDINANIFEKSNITLNNKSNGSHKSGADLFTSIGDFSNKSIKQQKNSWEMSSYRLTKVCSNNTPGVIEDIVIQINKNKNFQYYSILVRIENEKNKEIVYEWYIIPSDHDQLNPSSYEWQHKIGKQGKNKGNINGWKTNDLEGSSMNIDFSMSSQLWITMNIENFKKYMVSSCKVKIGRVLDLCDICEIADI